MVLNLWDNRIKDKGAEYLAIGLQTNMVITILFLFNVILFYPFFFVDIKYARYWIESYRRHWCRIFRSFIAN